jgi:hypothetical protein
VERIDQYSFYEFGKTMRKLIGVPQATSADDMFLPLMDARTKLKRVLNGDPLELGLSKVRAKAVWDELEKFNGRHFYVDDEEGGKSYSTEKAKEPVKPWEWLSLSRKIESFETVFREEMREAATYLVPQRGIFDVAKLIDSADVTFPVDLRQHISEKAKGEWKAAGRCLAFNLFLPRFSRSASSRGCLRMLLGCLWRTVR